MNIQITDRRNTNGDTSSDAKAKEVLREYVSEKIMTKLKHYSDHITQIHITLSGEREQQTIHAEVSLNLPIEDVVAHASDNKMHIAIDVLFEKLKRQLNDSKDKKMDQDHRGEKPELDPEVMES